MKHTILYTAITAVVLSLNALTTGAYAQNKKTGTGVVKPVYETDPTTGIQYHFLAR